VRYIISSSSQWWWSSSCHYCYHHRIIILLSSSYRYYYCHHHSRIIVAETPARRVRVHVWRRPAPGGGATATKHGRRNFTVCPTKRSSSRRKPDRTACVAVEETCDIRLPGGDIEVLGRIERERGVRRQWPFAGVGTGILWSKIVGSTDSNTVYFLFDFAISHDNNIIICNPGG